MRLNSKLCISSNDMMKGKNILLEPVSIAHHKGLRAAADYEQIWQYMPRKATKDLFNAWFDECCAKMISGEQVTYVVRHKMTQVILGATACYDIQVDNKRLALGYTWYMPEVWGSPVNPESKLLMLIQAFEHWGMNRVEIGTDARNIHSYHAIKKLGATEEGRLRHHMILYDGAVTDTVIFSIISSEWPNIKNQLLQRI